jgi:hypothetical protein
MAFRDWLRRLFGSGRPPLCERCSRLLAPAVGSHFEGRCRDASRAIEAHARLVRRAWRAEYPQEGGEDLYQCRDCGSWWGHSVWTCLPQERLVRHKVRSVEAWVKKWSCGEVLP